MSEESLLTVKARLAPIKAKHIMHCRRRAMHWHCQGDRPMQDEYEHDIERDIQNLIQLADDIIRSQTP
jgi:N6-adenosine-specific RNA methylase IME4